MDDGGVEVDMPELTSGDDPVLAEESDRGGGGGGRGLIGVGTAGPACAPCALPKQSA